MPMILGLTTILFWVAFLVMSLWLTYLLGLLLVACAYRRKTLNEASPPEKRFAIVVPAHNEALNIERTVESLLAIDYPQALFEIVVVADNCTDNTAEIVRRHGVRCLERTDADLRGKGHALKHGFTVLLSERFDAFIVIDADTIAANNLLLAVNARLRRGDAVIQVYNGIANPEASPLSYFFFVGNLIENNLFYTPKEHLRMSSLLRGNGMCFSRKLLEELPWNAHSIVEDTEYSISLLRAGYVITFAYETSVLAHQPENLDQAYGQRVRWASGNATVAKKAAMPLLLEGIKKRNRHLVDAALTLLVQSKPLMVLNTALLVFLSSFIVMTGGSPLPLAGALFVVAMVTTYFFVGILWNGFRGIRLFYLTVSPAYLLWMVLVKCLGMTGFKNTTWFRTKRA